MTDMIDEIILKEKQQIRMHQRELEPKKGGVEAIRARRIRDKQRMKAKARWVARNSWGWSDRSHDQNDAIVYADNLKKCSCWRCGNRRKHEGLTFQERRELDKTADMMKRSPHLLGPRRVDPVREINRLLRRKIRQMLVTKQAFSS